VNHRKVVNRVMIMIGRDREGKEEVKKEQTFSEYTYLKKRSKRNISLSTTL